MRKIITVALATIWLTLSAYAWYPEVDCSTNTKFGEYSCNQCFDWWELKWWDVLWFLDDLWVNNTTNDKILYEEEQTMPVMNNLNGAEFAKEPVEDSKFWEFTSEVKALKDEDLWGYVLKPGSNVVWLKSSMWSAYKMTTAPTSWKEAWMLVYDILSHNIVWSGSVTDEAPHKECVLFNWIPQEVTPIPEPVEPTPEPKEMTKVQTWPEHVVLFILALLVWYIIINRRKIFNR